MINIVQLLVNTLIAGSFAAIMAVGLALVYGTLKVFNLALGQFALVGGYMTWWFVDSLGWPMAPGIIGGILCGALVSWISFEIAVAPFYKRHPLLPLVSTIALSQVLDGLIQLIFKEQTRSIIVHAKKIVHIGSALISVEQIRLIIFTVALLSFTAWMLHSTPLGRRIRATVEHSQAAESLGISSAILHRLVFIISGTLAAIAGIYIGIDQNLTPVLGFTITIKAYAALIAGGKGNLWGAVLASYFIAAIEQLAIGIRWFGFFIPAGYQGSIALIVIIVFLLIKPTGLFGRTSRFA